MKYLFKNRTFKIIVKTLFSIGLLALFTYPFWERGHALTEEAITNGTIIYSSSSSSFDFEMENDLSQYIPEFVTTPEGGIPWDDFSATKSIEYSDKDEEGREVFGIRPEFNDDLKKLDGQTILMQGYMFPLEAEEEQALFLFGPFPVGCPYHYHAGPNLIIEAHAKDKIKFDWDAVNIKGRLELVPRDDEYNVFYRLHDVILIKP